MNPTVTNIALWFTQAIARKLYSLILECSCADIFLERRDWSRILKIPLIPHVCAVWWRHPASSVILFMASKISHASTLKFCWNSTVLRSFQSLTTKLIRQHVSLETVETKYYQHDSCPNITHIRTKIGLESNVVRTIIIFHHFFKLTLKSFEHIVDNKQCNYHQKTIISCLIFFCGK